jgi:hypothetical protein
MIDATLVSFVSALTALGINGAVSVQGTLGAGDYQPTSP